MSATFKPFNVTEVMATTPCPAQSSRVAADSSCSTEGQTQPQLGSHTIVKSNISLFPSTVAVCNQNMSSDSCSLVSIVHIQQSFLLSYSRLKMKFWMMCVDSYPCCFSRWAFLWHSFIFAPILATLINAHIDNIFSKQ